MSNSMTFEREGDYLVCYINGKEVSRAKVKSAGADEQEIIDVINDQIKVNPTLAGTEPNLTGLQMGDDKYANPEGTSVIANPTLIGGESLLESIEINDVKYKVQENIEIVYVSSTAVTTISSDTFTKLLNKKAILALRGTSNTDYVILPLVSKVKVGSVTTLSFEHIFYSGDRDQGLKRHRTYVSSNNYDVDKVRTGILSPMMSTIIDYQNKRFVEGDGTTNTISGVTFSYCKWSLSGTHIMFVCAGTMVNSVSAQTFCTFTIPQWIHDKIVGIGRYGEIELKATTAYGIDSSSSAPVNFMLQKLINNPEIIIKLNDTFSRSSTLGFRIQFDLLIDAS